MISIISISQLQDNYSFIIINKKEAIIIDPADSIPILKYIEENQLLLKAILLTHHHKDHTAGVENILSKKKIPVYSPNKDIKNSTVIIKDRSSIDLDFIKIEVIGSPGHTIDHVIFYSKENNVLFSGDTLFRLGCGKVFEGTYEQMFSSLQKIHALDDKTTVYCGHEYTNTNLNFLKSIFPEDKNLIAEKKKIDKQIKETGSSIPFNLGKEKTLNPFLSHNLEQLYTFKNENNLSNFELFSYLRDLKNNF